MSSSDYSKEIVEEYGGILPYHEVFYISAVRMHARKCVDSFQKLDGYLYSDTPDSELAFFELHSALVHAACISRLFWPASKDELAQARGDTLRGSFTTEWVEIIKNRRLRNRIEHFDEYLDRYLAREPVGEIIDLAIENHRLFDPTYQHVIRLIDPEAESAILLNELYSFMSISHAVSEILREADAMERSGGRLGKR